MVIFLGGEVRVVDGYVLVCNESVPDQARGRKVLAAVDLALERSGYRAVLFDTRDMPPPPEEVNEILRAWVDRCKYHDKVALLVRSDLKLIASNMRAIAAKVKLRSFHDLAEAEAWLRAPVPVRRSRDVTEPMELPLPDPRKPSQPASGPHARAEGSKSEGEPEPSKTSQETQPRFVWRSALLREYLGD